MFVLAALLLSAPAAAERPPPDHRAAAGSLAERCGSAAVIVRARRKLLRIHPLGDEPPAAELRAVYRSVGGCPAPVVLRKGIGAHPERQLPITGGIEPRGLDR